MPRNLHPRFQQHIARARRARIIGGGLLVTCLVVGTGAALTQTQLPYQVAATLKPIASIVSSKLSQLPSSLSDRISKFDPQLPPAANQLAASATSFPQSVAEKVRNLFCRWLGCARELAATSTSRISNEDITDIGSQQRATLPPNVKQPASIPSPTGDATTTSQVVVSKASGPAPASPSASSQPPARIIERTNTIIQSGITEALLDARLLALTDDLNRSLRNQAVGIAESVARAPRIQELTGLTAHDLTVDGVSGLTDADLPDSLTASNYLPLTGGNLTGDLTLSGVLTAGSLSVAGVSSGGAIFAPYFTATSSIATSSFAGAITALGPVSFANSSNFFGLTSFGATGTTTIATNGTISTPSIIAQNAAATSTFAGGAVLALTGGNVGVGSASPAYKLDVSGTLNTRSVLHFGSNSESAFASADHPVVYATGAGGSSYPFLTAVNLVLQSRTSGAARDIVFVGNTTPAAQVVIQGSSGNVGIGTTTPVANLNVFRASGAADPSLTSDAGDIFNIGSHVTPQLAFGAYASSPFGMWMQTKRQGNDGNSYPLIINPLGGNVGIGSTTPWAKLSITNTGTGPSFIVEDSTSPDTTPFIVDASGNVGIGVTAPLMPLQVNSSGNGNGIFLRRIAGSNGDGSNAGIVFNTADASVITNTYSKGGIFFDNSTTFARGRIYLAVNTAADNSNVSVSDAKLTIDTTGNVGIGTTSPSTHLPDYPSSYTACHNLLIAFADS